ncbi:MAG: hypothetical protein K2J90_09670 [Lachnospiraceae bacterium]|nr:hypothetical protein [Lachnospiraceae bacterium]
MKKILSLFLCIWIGIMGGSYIVEAAQPRVMVSDYLVKEGEVVSGKEFTLTLTLSNTASKAVKNIKLTISTENGELLPQKGAGTEYVEQIDAYSEEKLTFKMKAANGLEEKAYKLSVKTEYESSGGMGYTVDETVFIPVILEQRLTVTDIFLAEDMVELGDTVEISAAINNLGEGTLYNVSAMIEGDNLDRMMTYVGNIESGKSGTLDALTKAVVVTEGMHTKNKMIISYEDKKGNKYESEAEIGVTVLEPVYENLEKVKESRDSSHIIKVIVKIIFAIVIIAAIIWFFIRRKKRKQQMLDDFVK